MKKKKPKHARMPKKVDKMITKDEIEKKLENAVKRIDEAFTAKHITVGEVAVVLPLLIISIFKDADMLNNAEAQQKFFRDLENTVFTTLQRAKEQGVGL